MVAGLAGASVKYGVTKDSDHEVVDDAIEQCQRLLVQLSIIFNLKD
jgi:hypothetical protein